MTDMLSYINSVLSEIIPYEYGEWTEEVSYPYFVGTFDESDFRYEDNRSTGTFTIDGWTRESKYSLLTIAEVIKETFNDLQIVQNNLLFFISYSGAQIVPSGEEDLHHIVITLNTSEWKGE